MISRPGSSIPMEVEVRPARPSDKAPLMSFIKDVWGGHDYIPQVWDIWIRDTKNRMFVVVVDGVPVGMNRIRFMDDGSAWFEGARIHPRFRSQGLGTMLGENSLEVAKRMGVRTYRLTSGSTNHPAHRQIARIGFREVARFRVYEPPKRHRGGGGPEMVGPGEAREAFRSIRETAEFRLAHGVFWQSFAATSLTEAAFGSLIAEKSVWRLGRALAIARRGGEVEDWEQLSFVGGATEDAVNLAKALLGRRREAAERMAFIPKGSRLIHALRAEGFKRSYSNILFERRATKG